MDIGFSLQGIIGNLARVFFGPQRTSGDCARRGSIVRSWIRSASTVGGRCVYYKDLWQVPVVATVDFSTRNMDFLSSHDYLKKKENVHFLRFKGRPGETPPATKWPLDADEA